MAKTVDEIVLKTSVEGATNLDQLNEKLANIEKSSKQTATSMNQVQGGVRNVAYQIQDLAVQLSMGTNAFMALGQQLPQLLSGFGTIGVVIGAVAAVAIPLLQAGLKAAGIDMRNLKEMTDDLGKSNDAYIAAQRQNQTTLTGLGATYGSLTEEAKNFFEVQEKLTRSKATRDNVDAVKELKDEYEKLSKESVDKIREQARFSPMAGSAAADAGIWFRQFRKGLTEEQGYAVSSMLKEIDGASPEKTVKAINNVLTYLSEIGPQADGFKQSFEKSVEPLMKINAELIKSQTNIREAAQQASALQTELLGLQNKYQPDINAARRNFDQVTAAQLEGQMKVSEFNRQMAEKNKDGVDRTAEAEAGRLRISQETADKVADFVHGQSEAYKSIMLGNDGKLRQLELENKITELQDKGRYTLSYQLQYEQDLAKNAKDYADTLASIDEQRRKNILSASQAADAEAAAAVIKAKADEASAAAMEKRKNDARDIQSSVIFDMDAKIRGISYDERSLKIRQDMRHSYQEDIDTAVKIQELKNAQAEAEARIQRQKELGKISEADAAEQIAKSNEELAKQITLQEKLNAEALRRKTGSGLEGAEDAFSRIMKNNRSIYEQMGASIDAVYNRMGDALDNFVDTGKFKFSDFARSVVQDLIKIQLRAQMTQLLGNVLGMGPTGKSTGGGLFGMLGGLFKAEGGPVNQNQPYIVGEKGPEAFIPSSAGTIIPNNQLNKSSLGATVVNYNINAVDSMSFKQMLAKDPTFLYALTQQGAKAIPATRR